MRTKFWLCLKMICSVFFCFVFSGTLTVGSARESSVTGTTDQKDGNLDFETILAGIQYYDGLVTSGIGKVVYTIKQPRFPIESPNHSLVFSCEYIFEEDKIRLNSSTTGLSGKYIFEEDKILQHSMIKTYVITPARTWEVVHYRTRKPNYYFRTESYLPEPLADPREWLSIGTNRDLSTYLREKDFRVKRRDVLNDVPCYLLEARKTPESPSTQPDSSFERIWISPERGFRYLKHEEQSPLKVDVINSDIKKGTVVLRRITVSYQQHGEAWFPDAGRNEAFWLDPEGAEHIIIRMVLETSDFKVNLPIPPESFTFDIPDDALIKVVGLQKKLSKKEFLKRYMQKTEEHRGHRPH